MPARGINRASCLPKSLCSCPLHRSARWHYADIFNVEFFANRSISTFSKATSSAPFFRHHATPCRRKAIPKNGFHPDNLPPTLEWSLLALNIQHSAARGRTLKQRLPRVKTRSHRASDVMRTIPVSTQKPPEWAAMETYCTIDFLAVRTREAH